MNNELLYSILLSLAGGYANPFAWNAYIKYGGSENACRELLANRGGPDVPQRVKMRLEKYPLKEAEKIYGICERSGIKIVTRADEDYPEMLENISDPPFLLYYRGDIGELTAGRPMIAVVGARYPTNYSLKVASSLSRDLTKCGFGIVSGFAVGTDISAHLAACAAGGYTCAVTGCGLNVNYPRENFPYADVITEHGAIISEYPPDYPPRAANFPIRNRILAGLAIGTVVVEAGLKSGSLVTADHTANQGKTAFVVPPGDIFNKAYSGNVLLLRQCAPLVMSARDIVNEYFERFGHKLSRTAEIMFGDAGANMSLAECERKAEGKEAPDADRQSAKIKAEAARDNRYYRTVSDKIREFADGTDPASSEDPVPPWEGKLTGDRLRCAEIIKGAERPLTADEIAEELGSSVSEMLLLLTEMELDGIIRSAAGKTYSLNC